MKKAGIFIFALVIITTFSEASTIYVSTNGNDANPGTSNLPIKTIQVAIGKSLPGDRIVVRRGVYNGAFNINVSGTVDNPIIIEGEVGPNGELLTEIRGGKVVSNWTPAPEIGQGVYKTNTGIYPYSMSIDGKQMDFITYSYMIDDRWLEYFRSDVNYTPVLDFESKYSVKFWDVTYGIFGTTYSDYITYIRLKDYSNPSNYEIRVAYEGNNGQDSVYIRNQSYITLKNFKLSTFANAIRIDGVNAHNIRIDNNIMSSGMYNVVIERGAHDIVVNGNEMTMNHYGLVNPGTWGTWGSGETYEDALQNAFYTWYHHVMFGRVAGVGVYFVIPGDDINISGNYIHDGLLGLYSEQSYGSITNRIKLFNNTIINHSSVGIAILPGFFDFEIYNNKLANNNINIRLHYLSDQISRRVYIYNNILNEPEDFGDHIFFHWETNKPIPIQQPEIYIYHNSINGGKTGMHTNYYGPEYYLGPNFYIINNIISSKYKMYIEGENNPLNRGIRFGSFNYNWVGDFNPIGSDLIWFGLNNTRENKTYFWTPAGGSNFNIYANSSVFGKGIDLSKSNVFGGKVIGPLPGMDSYYCKSPPDIGAIQLCSSCVNGQTKSCGLSNVGICKLGNQTCSSGNWQSCIGAVYPVNETCNLLDDNCNGVIDDGLNCNSNEKNPDINNDGRIDLLDIMLIVRDLGKTGTGYKGDLDNNGRVDMEDIYELLKSWS